MAEPVSGADRKPISEQVIATRKMPGKPRRGPRIGCTICNATGQCVCYDDEEIWVDIEWKASPPP